MSNAFAPILRARPNPIFGRPVHQGSLPFDYSPILLLKPFGFQIAPDTLSSSERTRWPARHYPHLWIQRPSFKRRRDFNPPDSCAAQRTIRPRPTPAMAAAFRDVEVATLALDGPPPITRTTFPTCRAHYPGGSSGCACRLLPRSCCLPQMTGRSASALSLSRPAQASLTLRPARLLNRLKRPLSRGSSPAGYPTEPLVSYQINRQLSGWNLPPLVIRAFGAHGQSRTWGRISTRSAKFRRLRPPIPTDRDQCVAGC